MHHLSFRNRQSPRWEVTQKYTCAGPVRTPEKRGRFSVGFTIVVILFLMMTSCAPQTRRVTALPSARSAASNVPQDEDCAIQELKLSEVQGFKVYAPDGKRYLINKEDQKGTAQIYIGTDGGSGLTCITCEQRPGGPKPKRFKMQPKWHASGRWIFLAAERDKYDTPFLLGWSRNYVEGMLQSGLWTNMYVVSPDGMEWHRLTDFKSNVHGVADGFTGPALTPDGKKAVWSQIVSGNIFKYWPFGKWELILADFDEIDGVPRMTNLKDITPAGMHWNEPGNFHPDNETFLFSGSDQKDAQGMDTNMYNIRTGQVTNLTQSPTVWDEHGVFSPDGEKILFMSAYPYRDNPKTSKVLSIKTEFMLRDVQTDELTQLTHFRERGYPEYSKKGGIAANGSWSPDGRTLTLNTLLFPNYQRWDLIFQGHCGNKRLR